MTETPTSVDPKKPTWYARLGDAWERLRGAVFTWWHTGNRSAAMALLVLALMLICLAAGAWMLWAPRDPVPAPDTAAQIAALDTRVQALEAAAAQVPEQTPSPDPAPARPGAPRAALRPTPPAAPASAPSAWGTTDLDRSIADFPSTNLLEQSQ